MIVSETVKEINRIGIHSFSDSRLIEISLGVAKETAKTILQDIGTLGMKNSKVDDLIPYLGSRGAVRAVAAMELSRRALIKSEMAVTSPATGLAWFQNMAILKQEVFRVVFLDGRRQVLGCEDISVGTLTQCLVHPREVFRPAIEKSAAAILVGHNHPSGDPTPSSDDFAMTDRLAQAGILLGIELMDHLIVSRTGYRSLRALGRIGQTEVSESSDDFIESLCRR